MKLEDYLNDEISGGVRLKPVAMMNVETGKVTASTFVIKPLTPAVPTLAELNQSKTVMDAVTATVVNYINQSSPDQKILPDQAQAILKDNPAAAAAILKEALKNGTLPDALKGDSEDAKKLKTLIQVYANALDNDGQKKDMADAPKARSLTLADAIPSSSPMVVQGDGKLAAAAVKPETEMKVVDPATGTVGPTTTARGITNPTPTAEPSVNTTQVAQQTVKREMALG